MDARNRTDYLRVLRRLTDILVYVFCFFFVASVVIAVAFNHPPHGQGNIAAAKAQIKQFELSLVFYKKKFGALPVTLDKLIRPPSGDPIMNAKEVPLDPWGNPYQYSLVGLEEFVIVSLGADDEVGGDDEDADIRSDEIAINAAK